LSKQRQSTSISRWIFWAGAAIIVGVGIALRLIALGSHPYGLYQDEAVNGLDALRVLDGYHPLYFPANNGREPLFIYLMAATVGLFGPTALGVRAAAAILGILTLPAAYLMGEAWANKRVGGLSAAILAGMVWHVHLSRVGFRAVALPLFSALALGLGAVGLRRGSKWAMVGAGLAWGLSFYTYLPARFTPLALGLMLLYGWLWQRDWLRERWPLLAWAGGAALIVSLPLIVLTIRQPDLVFGRGGQVGIWQESVNQGHLLATAARHTIRTLGMFVWRGDTIWRHNVPGRPVFDPLLSTAFVGGVALGVIHWRKQPALALSLIWVAVMMLPTILAEDAPHFLRGVGVLPVVVLIPACALDAAADWAHGRFGVQCWIEAVGLIAILALSIALTANAYFVCRGDSIERAAPNEYTGCYRGDPVLGYFFQAAATDLAGAINDAEGAIYLDRRLWDGFPSVRFLVTDGDRVRLYGEGEQLERAAPPFSLIAWPHADLSPVLSAIPDHSAVEVIPGPFTRGDLEPEPYRLFVRWTVSELEEAPPALAAFENGIELIDVQSAQGDDSLAITLRWRAENRPSAPVQAFVHLLDAGSSTTLAQVDEPPGSIYYPPLSWGAGSVIIHHVILPTMGIDTELAEGLFEGHLLIGLYDPVTNTRLHLTYTSAMQRDEALLLPVAGQLTR
jgi:4-amino-4-deoxy-L-arabinose transferase-like glycosyltransferase